jgi:hypothetical protein
MSGEVSQTTLARIEKLMTASVLIPISDAAKIKAAERALAKIAP